MKHHVSRRPITRVTFIASKSSVLLFKSEPFDLVITDMVMPRKDGLVTIDELRMTQPNIHAEPGIRWLSSDLSPGLRGRNSHLIHRLKIPISADDIQVGQTGSFSGQYTPSYRYDATETTHRLGVGSFLATQNPGLP